MPAFPIVTMFDLEINLSNWAYIPYYVICSLAESDAFAMTRFWPSDNSGWVTFGEQVPQAGEEKHESFLTDPLPKLQSRVICKHVGTHIWNHKFIEQ